MESVTIGTSSSTPDPQPPRAQSSRRASSSSPILGTTESGASREASGRGAAGRDHVQVSEAARDLVRAESAVGDASEIRFDVVSRLRSAIRAGTYRVDADAVARAMVRHGEQP